MFLALEVLRFEGLFVRLEGSFSFGFRGFGSAGEFKPLSPNP